jgi:hypothetical protein
MLPKKRTFNCFLKSTHIDKKSRGQIEGFKFVFCYKIKISKELLNSFFYNLPFSTFCLGILIKIKPNF